MKLTVRILDDRPTHLVVSYQAASELKRRYITLKIDGRAFKLKVEPDKFASGFVAWAVRLPKLSQSP